MPQSAAEPLWTTLSLIGAPRTMTALGALLIAIALKKRQPRLALTTLLIAGSGGLLTVALKTLVHRARPIGAERFIHDASWSFPSGHTMGATIGFGLLLHAVSRLWRLPRGARIGLQVAALALVAGVGISRVALGVHYPGDVVGGWLIGGAWLWTGLALEARGAHTTAPATPER